MVRLSFRPILLLIAVVGCLHYSMAWVGPPPSWRLGLLMSAAIVGFFFYKPTRYRKTFFMPGSDFVYERVGKTFVKREKNEQKRKKDE